ncbi:MAG: hypothetical protein ABIF11_11915 [Nitrospirota bacterium]
MWLKGIENKKLITIIIGTIILIGLSLFAFRVTYNIVYNKSVQQEIISKEKKEKAEVQHKRWVTKITGAKESQSEGLVEIHKDYKVDADILKLIFQVSSKFNVSPNMVLQALGMIDLNAGKSTKQRILLTLKKQKDKLYWLETKNSTQQTAWIKERKEIINMCRIELALLNKAQKDKEIKAKLEILRIQYLHRIYPRVYPWKEKAEGKSEGGH